MQQLLHEVPWANVKVVRRGKLIDYLVLWLVLFLILVPWGALAVIVEPGAGATGDAASARATGALICRIIKVPLGGPFATPPSPNTNPLLLPTRRPTSARTAWGA